MGQCSETCNKLIGNKKEVKIDTINDPEKLKALLIKKCGQQPYLSKLIYIQTRIKRFLRNKSKFIEETFLKNKNVRLYIFIII